ncbi:MAG: diguanylate cyclase [Candidatus Nitrohelix vancouverensis]|uniref:diguanylate cyclase n=1 Tax=Candidatus Nitrohelix vancouverensis TaxID=2705534 RepID=A0A7T0G4L3_9BACT|nr:MAG: diguanylate cyclase [Candidatus Nitrohelix vancouverensis]
MTVLKDYILKNAEGLILALIMFSATWIHLFVPFKISILNFYYLPIMITGYLLGKRLAILYAFFTVLLIWIFILANKSAYLIFKDQFELNIDLTLWGGFLILAGWAGSLSENLKDELKRRIVLQEELAQDRERLRILNKELNEANVKLENKILERNKELEESNEELKKLSLTDPLTKLLNRRSCDERFQYEMARFDRAKIPFCVILCDLDHFKEINDSFGHDAGDYVLAESARILKENARRTDMIFRWGGEEFLALLTGTEMKGALAVAEKFRATIEETQFEKDDAKIKVTLSLGVSLFQSGQSMSECIKVADQNLYAAKQAGRNLIVPARAEP